MKSGMSILRYNAESLLFFIQSSRNAFTKRFSIMKALSMVALAVFMFAGCRTSDVPGFKQLAEREDNRITSQTREAIQKSPRLQEIDRKCVREIVHPADFVLFSMRRDPHSDRLSYGYRSKDSYQNVKRYYIEHLGNNGWQNTDSQDKGWGLPFVEFRKDDYTIRVSYQGTGTELNYTVACEKLVQTH